MGSHILAVASSLLTPQKLCVRCPSTLGQLEGAQVSYSGPSTVYSWRMHSKIRYLAGFLIFNFNWRFFWNVPLNQSIFTPRFARPLIGTEPRILLPWWTPASPRTISTNCSAPGSSPTTCRQVWPLRWTFFSSLPSSDFPVSLLPNEGPFNWLKLRQAKGYHAIISFSKSEHFDWIHDWYLLKHGRIFTMALFDACQLSVLVQSISVGMMASWNVPANDIKSA